MSKNYSYFSHKECEYFPCHKGADVNNFNCLFCYCPLYALVINVVGIFPIFQMAVKTVVTVCFHICVRIMMRLMRDIRIFYLLSNKMIIHQKLLMIINKILMD